MLMAAAARLLYLSAAPLLLLAGGNRGVRAADLDAPCPPGAGAGGGVWASPGGGSAPAALANGFVCVAARRGALLAAHGDYDGRGDWGAAALLGAVLEDGNGSNSSGSGTLQASKAPGGKAGALLLAGVGVEGASETWVVELRAGERAYTLRVTGSARGGGGAPEASRLQRRWR